MATIPLTQSNPELCREWHPTLNGYLTPDKVSAGSGRKVWWLGKCGHTWEARVGSRSKLNRGCLFCSNQEVLKGFNDLGTKFPHLVQEWHPTLNGDLTPSEVIAGTKDKAWWLGKCGHTWEASIGSRTSKRNTGCGICSGNSVLIGFNDLATTHPELVQEWHPTLNTTFTPEKVSAGSNAKIWWLGKCGHTWEASAKTRAIGEHSCSYCKGKRTLTGFNDFHTTHPELASEWHPTLNGDLTPQKIRAGSKEKVWWLGKCGHTWDAIVQNRTGVNRRCPYCTGQKKIDWL